MTRRRLPSCLARQTYARAKVMADIAILTEILRKPLFVTIVGAEDEPLSLGGAGDVRPPREAFGSDSLNPI